MSDVFQNPHMQGRINQRIIELSTVVLACKHKYQPLYLAAITCFALKICNF